MSEVNFSSDLPAEATVLPPGYNRTRYRAPGWQRLIYALAFLLVLPFAASLPIMIFQRAAFGDTGAVLPLLVLALFLGVLVVLLASEVLRNVRSRIDLGANALSFAIPHRGTLHPFRFAKGTIAYQDIKTVEVRNEVTGGTWAPVAVIAIHVLTHDGRDIRLGDLRRQYADRAFPWLLIARQIAQRSAVKLIFDRNVWRVAASHREAARLGVPRGVPFALTGPAIADIKQRHRRHSLLLANLVILIMIAGVTLDFASR